MEYETICNKVWAVARAIQFYFEEMPEDGMLLKVSGQKNCEIKEYEI